MIDFNRNNLDQATSPYLQQHKDTPLHWQEWSEEVIAYAKMNNKIIFVSVGYTTCHWCHVMANEAFSDQQVADFLNHHFVSIKVDREQRPDIDNYMMSFIQETRGQGGWPLNVFLTPDLKPFLAVTYVPLETRYGLSGFLNLLNHIKENYDHHKREIKNYLPQIHKVEHLEEGQIIQIIRDHFIDNGFAFAPQFPPHNTLLLLLSYYEKNKDKEIKEIVEKILEVIATRGLHDHLQGGFYRYCIDHSWTIPHFEKMLYDQAMLLWVYSLAYKILKKTEYKTVVEKIVECLEQTYANSLYYSGHDADTDHQEGQTYLWSKEELQEQLTKLEYDTFIELYEIEKNFEGGIHLIKKKNSFLPEIEQKLLRIRKQRKQPFSDQKYITSWNALTGIGLINAYRSLNDELLKAKAIVLFKNILATHYCQGVLHHSSYNGKLQEGEFLEDYAALLLFATYIYEETGEYKELIETLYLQLDRFWNHQWIESVNTDFIKTPASTFDHPIPSSTSLGEMAKLRASIILGKEYPLVKYKQPLQHDFFNLMVFIKNGNWHLIHAPHRIEWKHLPANSMQIQDTKIQDCSEQKCREFKDVSELLAAINAKEENV